MGEKIVGSKEKKEQLEKMVNDKNVTSSDMVAFIMKEKTSPLIGITMKNVEQHKTSDAAQHEQLHQIQQIQSEKSKDFKKDNTSNVILEELHFDSEKTNSKKLKEEEKEENEEHGREH